MAQVTSAISDAEKERILKICKEKDWNQSQLLRKAIKDYLDSLEKDKGDKPKKIKTDDSEFNEKVDFLLSKLGEE